MLVAVLIYVIDKLVDELLRIYFCYFSSLCSVKLSSSSCVGSLLLSWILSLASFSLLSLIDMHDELNMDAFV